MVSLPCASCNGELVHQIVQIATRSLPTCTCTASRLKWHESKRRQLEWNERLNSFFFLFRQRVFHYSSERKYNSVSSMSFGCETCIKISRHLTPRAVQRKTTVLFQRMAVKIARVFVNLEHPRWRAQTYATLLMVRQRKSSPCISAFQWKHQPHGVN